MRNSQIEPGTTVRVLHGRLTGSKGEVLKVEGRHVTVRLSGGPVLLPVASVEVV